MAHLVRNGAMAGAFIALSLTMGAVGYRSLAHLPWIDAYLNAAMILTGMGPVAALTEPGAKLFAIAYSLYSAMAFLTVAAVILGPVVTRLLHKLHLDMDSEGPADDHPA
ncbi:MAG: hypothetical protein ABI910_12575 [Gemmatimonadota bacterium]